MMEPECLFRTAKLGKAASCSCRLSRSNRGLSVSLYRAKSAGITPPKENSIAIRHPVVANDLLITSIMPLAAIAPKGTPIFAKDIQNALERRSAANSASNEEVPPNSPPSRKFQKKSAQILR